MVSGNKVDAGWVLMDGKLVIHVSSREPGAVGCGRMKEILGTVEAAVMDALTDTGETTEKHKEAMTIDEYYRRMEERTPKRECSTCSEMPSCWLHDKDFAFDAMKDCWTVRPVPSYINNIKNAQK